MRKILLLLAVSIQLITFPVYAAEVLIGSGSKSGVYFQAGRALCRIISKSPGSGECEVLETAGSVFNLANVQNGALECGLVQSDV